MDRAIVYPQEMASDTDVLNIGKFAMVGLGWLIQAVLGTSSAADGLACTPGTGLNVSVAAGAVYFPIQTDSSAYGSLGTDTHNVMKQGLLLDPATLAVPALGTSGQSVNYLIQATYIDQDSGSTVLNYYNASNPSVPYSGPGGGGGSNYTLRKGVCVVTAKAGTPATTGTQTTPSPDSGYIGLYSVTIAFGASSVTTGNISQLSTAPFIRTKLPAIAAAIQNNSYSYAVDSGAANAMVASISPAPTSLTAGMSVMIKAAANNTGSTTLNLNGLGATTVKVGGANLTTGMIVAGQLYELAYDGTAWEMISPPSTGMIPSGTSVVYSGSTAPTGWLIEDGSAVSRTTYAALNALAAADSYSNLWGPGDGSNTFNLPDSRGQFQRGYDSGGSVDPGRTRGTTQASNFPSHQHNTGLSFTTGSTAPAIYGTTTADIGSAPAGATVHTDANTPAQQTKTSFTGTGSDNRPTNIARIVIIKI